jgi:hypothetical protein
VGGASGAGEEGAASNAQLHEIVYRRVRQLVLESEKRERHLDVATAHRQGLGALRGCGTARRRLILRVQDPVGEAGGQVLRHVAAARRAAAAPAVERAAVAFRVVAGAVLRRARQVSRVASVVHVGVVAAGIAKEASVVAAVVLRAGGCRGRARGRRRRVHSAGAAPRRRSEVVL